MQVFTTVLVRSYTWTLPEQDFRLSFGKVPPVHADGLRAVFRKKQPAA